MGSPNEMTPEELPLVWRGVGSNDGFHFGIAGRLVTPIAGNELGAIEKNLYASEAISGRADTTAGAGPRWSANDFTLNSVCAMPRCKFGH